MEETIAHTQNPIKDRILFLYLEICANSASLQNMIMSNAAGNKQLLFNEFRKQAFELYNLSYRYDKLNATILDDMHKWMLVKKSFPTNKFILKSIEVTNTYISELKRIQVIEM